MKKCFLWAKETHPDILRGGHRNPYQLENAIKSVLLLSLGLNSLPGSCEGRDRAMSGLNKKKLIGPILFLYYEESLVPSNLNSKLFRFIVLILARPNVYIYAYCFYTKPIKQSVQHFCLMDIELQFRLRLDCILMVRINSSQSNLWIKFDHFCNTDFIYANSAYANFRI